MGGVGRRIALPLLTSPYKGEESMWGIFVLFVYSWNSGSMFCFIILRDLRVLRGQKVFSSERVLFTPPHAV